MATPFESDDFTERYIKKSYKEAYAEEFEAGSIRDKVHTVFAKGVDEVAEGLLRIALTGTSERNRLSAQTYIIDRLAGKNGVSSSQDALTAAFDKMLSRSEPAEDKTDA